MKQLTFIMLLLPQVSEADAPTSVDPRLIVELVAREPEIVTPTGVAVDEKGRIFAIENHTHHRPADYKGPAGDRIRVYDDFGPDGRSRRVKTFADGFKNGMGLGFGPGGKLFFATRSEIMTLADTDGDDAADDQKTVVRLDTAGDYPHNGLSGFAFDALDNVYFGFGENLGAPYKLIASDGTTLTGGGEGGNIYRCRPDGSKLVRIATGFWNPFHLTFDAFGRLFAVDNDPDSRPPCRLLHIIPGGDYGYRFRNGRKGLHPFTSWNGELPGTLPMVAGTGEAPSGIVAYESDGLPDEYRGDLIVTSWGDHIIQRFKLRERGASFTSQAETLVRGGDNFYPVGITIAPDGSLVVSDWADKSYPLHGKGRIWRIRMKEPPMDDGLRPATVAKIGERTRLIDLLEHPKLEIRHAAARALATPPHSKQLMRTLGDLERLPNLSSRARIQILNAATRSGSEGVQTWNGASLWFYGNRPEVWAESARMIAEVLHPRSRSSFPVARAGKGAEWAERLSLEPWATLREMDAPIRMQSILGLHSPELLRLIIPVLGESDPFLVSAALESLGQTGNSAMLIERAGDEKGNIRLGVLLALRRAGEEMGRSAIPKFLDDFDPAVRRAAIQWVAEERLNKFEPLLEAAASKPPVARELFEAFLAAKDVLAGLSRKPTDEPSGEDFIVKILSDEKQSAALRAIALRTLRPEHAALSTSALRELLTSDDSGLRREVVRTLAARSDNDSQAILRQLATNDLVEPAVRSWAVVGLGVSASTSAESKHVLRQLLDHTDAKLQREAIRSLRGMAAQGDNGKDLVEWWNKTKGLSKASDEERSELAEQLRLALRPASVNGPHDVPKDLAAIVGPLPSSEEEWLAGLDHAGDAAAGERVFFHSHGPQCSACHRVNGRGGEAGPDLSAIGRSLDREKIARSILTPSKDIAPQYTTWLIATRSGQVFTGILLLEDPRGTITLGDAQGKTVEIPVADIEERRAQTKSIMPDNLIDQMTRQEFRDLVEFLFTLK